MRSDWGKMAEEYLSSRSELRLSIQLIDSRHAPTALDRQLNEWLSFSSRPYIIVATKSDKLTNNELSKSLKTIEYAFPDSKIIAYSAQSGRGRDAVWTEIESALAIS
jgi:GTP-binding protein